MLEDNLTRELIHLTRRTGEAREVDEVLNSIVSSILESLPEIDQAGISMSHRDGRIVTRTWSGALVTDLDDIQFQLGEGPCVDAMNPQIPDDIVRVDYARHEQRWPAYIPRAVGCGLTS